MIEDITESKEGQEERYRKLFQQLSDSRSGFISPQSVTESATIWHQHPFAKQYAQELIKICDTSKDGLIDYEEFRQFIEKREEELLGIFQQVDINGDEQIEASELFAALTGASKWFLSRMLIIEARNKVDGKPSKRVYAMDG